MPSRRPDIDVIVVGSGPAGSECARLLAERGHGVLVAEEHAGPGEPVHCTGVISAQAYCAFDLPESAIQSRLSAAEVTSPGGVTLRVELNGSHAYTVDRRAVDMALASRASKAGVAFLWDTAVRGLAVDGTGVTVTGVRRGEVWQERARAVVLATGARSRLPRQVGLATVREDAHGAQVDIPMESPGTMQVWVGRRLVPGGFGWVVPGESGWSRVGAMTRGKPREVLSQVTHRALNGGSERLMEQQVRVHPIPVAPRHPTYGDRVLSVGDAAGQVKMTTGGGVYYGLLASRVAADALAEGLERGRLAASHLARYEKLWQRLLGPEQRAGRILRRLASAVPDETMDDLFRFAEQRGLSQHLVEMVDFDWHARPGVNLALAVMAAAPGVRGLSFLRQVLS